MDGVKAYWLSECSVAPFIWKKPTHMRVNCYSLSLKENAIRSLNRKYKSKRSVINKFKKVIYGILILISACLLSTITSIFVSDSIGLHIGGLFGIIYGFLGFYFYFLKIDDVETNPNYIQVPYNVYEKNRNKVTKKYKLC
jgi:membrane associated rhomboid family serine protease